MKLIEKQDFIQATQLKKYKMVGLADALMKLMKLDKVNQTYEDLQATKGLSFIDNLLARFQITCQVSESDLAKIPQKGSFVVVSNHPFGMLDGLLLLKIFCTVRPEFKMMANFLLTQIKTMEELLISVNPFENQKEAYSSFSGMKKALHLLELGIPVGIFPAGEVSSYQTDSHEITDREWQKSVLKLIRKARVPVVPVYFQGSNSLIFQVLGFIHPALRTARLPSEFFNKESANINLRIGSPIPVKDQDKFESIKHYGRYLRARTYALGSTQAVKHFFSKNFSLKRKEKAINESVSTAILDQEIAQLRERYLINSQQNFEVFIVPSHKIAFVLQEIGRLREITFRNIGEGTLKETDLDEYDLYYHHLFIWDKEKHKIVGAYRMGKGKDILHKYGKKGFYVHSLFKLKDEILPILEQSVELGRSFIVQEYQQKRLPLFLLWQGILHFLSKNNTYRYLFGAVSISNNFSQISKSLMVEFVKRNYFDEHLAQWVKPRKQFKVNIEKIDSEIILQEIAKDFASLDKFIQDIEPANFSIPILLKKYISMNAQIIGFNIDPKFNDALDGLMILDCEQIPKSMFENLQISTKITKE